MGEKDKLLQQLDRCKSQLSAGPHGRHGNLNVSATSHDGRTASAEELKVGEWFVVLFSDLPARLKPEKPGQLGA